MTENREYDLLISEKEYIDKQISKGSDLQVRHYFILFTVIPLALGWTIKSDMPGLQDNRLIATILLLIVIAACFFFLQIIILYSQTIAWINYKKNVLGPKLRDLLELEENPFETMAGVLISPARPAMKTAVVTLLVAHILMVCAIWFMVLGNLSRIHVPFTIGLLLGVSFLMIAGSILGLIRLVVAIKKLAAS